ncbi:hypothetical protein EVB32_238 [Rhizobium phage RHph_TM39]|uniref:Uncharacterized protein n=2 Tax=Cuauhnahuacvirus TaxID=3044696 RepID=A0A7S5UWX5_9CAUD|nr:hypothetical protein PQC16_gp254 [Rhizobium phage RHph_TM30]YP_010671404.1 hypothetical protein PQC17_gp255 [Rhizobium phage RHph_Y65]QIG71725.1 hypothetical protein EVB94_254 [Rhizobium phage RHph_TM40]QIG72088.1 hypothetical protein EVB95_254 [Rhizobium phage RHph_TM2_3B]QIG72450.1 hypothetical protein EVB96_254 [Rhizobium phage RHph_TM3_3_6]QIG77226.1 hypothetical protein EVB32_238 [Rhizobium phage RHph_TM39]QIG77528.1 hypothetical protein EVB61_201 [Rhizobium phage RHph_TM21B]QIG77840
MNPFIKVETVDCNCDKIMYLVQISDGQEVHEVQIESPDLIPVLGRGIELLNAARRAESNAKT